LTGQAPNFDVLRIKIHIWVQFHHNAGCGSIQLSHPHSGNNPAYQLIAKGIFRHYSRQIDHDAFGIVE
jgi:hypothetical protein